METFSAYIAPGIPKHYLNKYLDSKNYDNTGHSYKAEVKIRIEKEKKNVDRLIKVVCDFFGIKPEKIKTKSRKRPFVIFRQLIHHFAFEMKIGSSNSIAERTGNCNHATVFNSSEKVKQSLMWPINCVFFNHKKGSEALYTKVRFYNTEECKKIKTSIVYNDLIEYISANYKK